MNDDELEGRLRNIFRRADPVPPEVTEFAQAALGWRRLDADLAELLTDSVLESEAALTRGTAEIRALTFRSADLTIDIEIQPDGDTFTLLGQLAPPDGVEVEAQQADGTVVASAQADSLGRFRLGLDGAGRYRLRVLREGRSAVETSWFAI